MVNQTSGYLSDLWHVPRWGPVTDSAYPLHVYYEIIVILVKSILIVVIINIFIISGESIIRLLIIIVTIIVRVIKLDLAILLHHNPYVIQTTRRFGN